MFAAALIAAAALAGAAAAATAAVHKSGATYHIEICPGPALPDHAHCHAHVVTDSRGQRIRRELRAKALPQGYGPADLRSAYGATAAGQPSTLVAVVDAYGYASAEADLGVYRSTYGLPACTSANGCFTKVNQSGTKGSYPTPDTGWAQETALDLDMVSAMCPNCRILLVEASSDSLADLAQAVDTAAALGARVISNSYGGGEGRTQGYEASYNHPGVAVTASSGDAGYGVEFPASSPHVIAAGGTSLYPAYSSRGWSEVAWRDGGSGCSRLYPKPSWQKDPKCPRRMEADVAAVADPDTGVAVYGPLNARTSGWDVYGGTSVSAALIAGVYGSNGGPVTYGEGLYADPGALHDVTQGRNGVCGFLYFCTAIPGYDGPTGLGTPSGPGAF